jgi:hypothetical protein
MKKEEEEEEERVKEEEKEEVEEGVYAAKLSLQNAVVLVSKRLRSLVESSSSLSASPPTLSSVPLPSTTLTAASSATTVAVEREADAPMNTNDGISERGESSNTQLLSTEPNLSLSPSISHLSSPASVSLPSPSPLSVSSLPKPSLIPAASPNPSISSELEADLSRSHREESEILKSQRNEEKMKHLQKRKDPRVWATWKGERLSLYLDGLAHVDSLGMLFSHSICFLSILDLRMCRQCDIDWNSICHDLPNRILSHEPPLRRSNLSLYPCHPIRFFDFLSLDPFQNHSGRLRFSP